MFIMIKRVLGIIESVRDMHNICKCPEMGCKECPIEAICDRCIDIPKRWDVNSIEHDIITKLNKFNDKKDMADYISLKILEYGQNDPKFKLGEIITYRPDEIRVILKKILEEDEKDSRKE